MVTLFWFMRIVYLKVINTNQFCFCNKHYLIFCITGWIISIKKSETKQKIFLLSCHFIVYTFSLFLE